MHGMDISKFIYNEETAVFLKKPFIIKDIKQNQNSSEYADIFTCYNLVSSWGQPIVSAEGEVVGIFSMYFEETVEPRDVDFQFLNRVAPIVTMAFKYFNQKNEISQLAFFDHTTGLRNIESFKKEIVKQCSSGTKGVIYIFEPGEYQNIVDLYGRQGGDEILRRLSVRLKKLDIFEQSILARYTSSAIIIATKYQPKQDFSHTDVEDMLLIEPYKIADKNVYITLKIGTSHFDEGISTDVSIQRADTALSAALKCVGTVIKQYDETQITAIQQEMEVLSHISSALKNKEFVPVLQPKVNIKTGEIESFEALARRMSKDVGFVSPAPLFQSLKIQGIFIKLTVQF